ncbi:hypothetical protein A4A49_34198 [Nicotiana attenuata]|uniref:DUF4283 domain-containing protein n=1 Tax=Nicotiana attenuata TaxID=49451 RepID=A0A1J6KAK8_NICAT|nr:hypothetical protein A4A49_34198 [Nicotiana attenuata]
MEVIRRSFTAQTELRGGVKIVHFNARTVYIDLDNEYDHTTVWTKQYMYIQGQRMNLQAWTPSFKPNEDTPIVLVWVIIPELPWHCNYMEVLSVLLSPIGKILHLDLASMRKTGGSVENVKMQVDLTKDKTHHMWLGFDDDQDVNGDGQWPEVMYEDLPTYCLHYNHLVHEDYHCSIRKREEEDKMKAAAETSENNENQNNNRKVHEGGSQHNQEQAVQGQNKNQNSKQKMIMQDQREDQQRNENKKAAAQQITRDNHSKNQWHSQKKKNFRESTKKVGSRNSNRLLSK